MLCLWITDTPVWIYQKPQLVRLTVVGFKFLTYHPTLPSQTGAPKIQSFSTDMKMKHLIWVLFQHKLLISTHAASYNSQFIVHKTSPNEEPCPISRATYCWHHSFVLFTLHRSANQWAHMKFRNRSKKTWNTKTSTICLNDQSGAKKAMLPSHKWRTSI